MISILKWLRRLKLVWKLKVFLAGVHTFYSNSVQLNLALWINITVRSNNVSLALCCLYHIQQVFISHIYIHIAINLTLCFSLSICIYLSLSVYLPPFLSVTSQVCRQCICHLSDGTIIFAKRTKRRTVHSVRDFRLPPWCDWGLRSSGMLRRFYS